MRSKSWETSTKLFIKRNCIKNAKKEDYARKKNIQKKIIADRDRLQQNVLVLIGKTKAKDEKDFNFQNINAFSWLIYSLFMIKYKESDHLSMSGFLCGYFHRLHLKLRRLTEFCLASPDDTNTEQILITKVVLWHDFLYKYNNIVYITIVSEITDEGNI